MKRTIILIAALSVIALGVGAQGAVADGQAAPSFALSGAVDPQLAYSVENIDSVFASVPGYTYSNASAFGQIEGKLSFSRDYTSLGLLDFTIRDRALLSHLDGSTLESMSLTINELYSDLNFRDLLYVRLGKQRLSWGGGLRVQPIRPGQSAEGSHRPASHPRGRARAQGRAHRQARLASPSCTTTSGRRVTAPSFPPRRSRIATCRSRVIGA